MVSGRLWIRAKSAMLGYLNAPCPFDAEGFFDTGDLVDVDGEWIRFLGRTTDVINVGGSKVYPAEVESALLEMEHVADAVVRGEAHAFTGQIVAATVRLTQPELPRRSSSACAASSRSGSRRTRCRCACGSRKTRPTRCGSNAFARSALQFGRFVIRRVDRTQRTPLRVQSAPLYRFSANQAPSFSPLVGLRRLRRTRPVHRSG